MKVAQSSPALCYCMNCTIHGILQARILEWVAFPFSRESSQTRNWTQVSHIAGGFFTSWATREAPLYKSSFYSIPTTKKTKNKAGTFLIKPSHDFIHLSPHLKKNPTPQAYDHCHVWIDNVINHKATALFLWMNYMGAILLPLLLFYSDEIVFS